VTGASGLLGRQVIKELESNSKWQVRGLCVSRISGNLVRCDLTESGQIETQFSEFQPDVVIHCAAERRPDVVFKQPEIAHALNIDVTSNLATACNKHNAWMIFFSTDYVFDGCSPPYSPDAETRPLSAYGEQKVAGEKNVAETCPNSTVLRIPLLFGPMEYMKESGVTTMYLELEKGIKKADHLQKRYPTYTPDVARIVHKMLEVHFNGGPTLAGTYHWQANECLTKWNMVQAIGIITGMDVSDVEASFSKPRFPTPPDSKLDCWNLEMELGIAGSAAATYRTPFKVALSHCFETFMKKNPSEGPVLESKETLSVPKKSSSNRPTISTAEASRVLQVLGASERLSQFVKESMSAEGEVDTEDFNQLLGSPMAGTSPMQSISLKNRYATK